MNYFMCDECHYIFQSQVPPDECPSCHKKCTFSNVTCYIPECGGPENLDIELVSKKIKESKSQG